MIWPYLDILIALVAAFLTYRFFRWQGQTPIESIMLAAMIGFTTYASAHFIFSAREQTVKNEQIR